MDNSSMPVIPLTDSYKIACFSAVVNQRDFFSIYIKLMNPHLMINSNMKLKHEFEISDKRAHQLRFRVFRCLGEEYEAEHK